MRLSIETRLVYRFQQPCEVLLLVEPARTPTQTVIHERLTAPPTCRLAQFEDPLSGERRAVFDAAGDVEIVYAAEVHLAPVDHDFAGRPTQSVRDLPADVLEYLRPSRYCPSDRLDRL